MITRIKKWGNSLALRIPKAMADQLKLQDSSEMSLSIKDDKLIAVPVQFSLAALLADIRDENLHTEIDTGASMGHENW